MKRILVLVVVLAGLAFTAQLVMGLGSDISDTETSKKQMGVYRYDEADARIGPGKADTTAWYNTYEYINAYTCWLAGEITGDSAACRVVMEVRNTPHAMAVYRTDSVTTLVTGDTLYICEQWTMPKPAKQVRFIRQMLAASSDSLWVAEFRTYFGQE